MKKVAIGFIFLFLISLASAVEIKLSKEAYAPEETLQAEIYGNFLEPIKVENIHFYRERNIPVEYDILKLKDKYLLYVLLPNKEGNYTIQIEDVRYEQDNIITEDDTVKGFQIIKGNGTFLKLDPGFIIARDDFYIKAEPDSNVDLEVGFLNQTQTVSLLEGKSKKIYFSIQGIENYTEETVSILDYRIPVFIFPNKSEVIDETSKFRFSPLVINTKILKSEGISFTVQLVNFGFNNITDIKITPNSSDLTIEVSPDSFEKIEAKEKEIIDISIYSEKTGNFSGKITAESSNLTAELEVNIEVTENRSEIIVDNNDSTGYVSEEKCEEPNGRICGAKEICSIDVVSTEDGYCCRGECKEEEELGDSSWIYGVVLIVVLLGGLIGFSFYIKKKQKKSVNPLKKREDKFQERMSHPPAPPSSEVKGNLTKI